MNKNIPDIGQNIPDFEAVTSDNKIFKLSEELKSGKNIKLMFYRGHWWPFCIHQLAGIQKNYDTYTRLDTRVFALSTDLPRQSSNLVRKLKLSFTLLCDEGKKVIDLFDLRNPLEHDGIARPATFIINPEGKIRYRSLDGTAKRVDLTDELAFLEQLQKDSGHTFKAKPKRTWVIPSLKDNWRISMNMLFTGNFADWKNLLLLPVNYLKIFGAKIKNR